ncbi:nucleotide exchange factor GrpE [Chengkuizengella sediminis]|uniref:nucleotide exchange factor GrpE n=1 Tax=Chengkuizengella sediminis TaxID=1885917 RepID=UPI00138A29D8|nr:nucleotide exchange factor GrpE [Chengkuizengella sediminis]NDI33753.1 nucleotide exchange factor GrpE [Chengkuizengella sediminis]
MSQTDQAKTNEQEQILNDQENEGLENMADENLSDEEEQNVEEQILMDKQDIDELKKNADESQQKLLRTQADFDNFRRRTRLEKEEALKYASKGLIEQLLPVIDNFERAISSSAETKDFDSLMKGIEMVFDQMKQTFDSEDLKPIESVGQPFNPEYHQAIMQVESEEHEEGIVVEEVQKGYILKDKVLRPAMVKVSS